MYVFGVCGFILVAMSFLFLSPRLYILPPDYSLSDAVIKAGIRGSSFQAVSEGKGKQVTKKFQASHFAIVRQ